MKYLLLYLTFCFATLSAFAQDGDFPAKPNRLVSDFANMMSANEVAALEQKLRNYHDTTSTQIAVVTIKSVGDYDINDYAARLGERWGIGGKANNNGLLILVALENRKFAISTGYGLEHVIPDGIAKRIVEQKLKPNFQQNQYFRGFDEATSEIISRASGEYRAPPRGEGDGEGGPSIFMIIIIVLLVVFILSRKGGGGGRGGRRGARTLGGPVFIPGGFGTFRTGGGMFGGGGGGFGGGGGGFGGFGGGSFGGGGASGSW